MFESESVWPGSHCLSSLIMYLNSCSIAEDMNVKFSSDKVLQMHVSVSEQLLWTVTDQSTSIRAAARASQGGSWSDLKLFDKLLQIPVQQSAEMCVWKHLRWQTADASKQISIHIWLELTSLTVGSGFVSPGRTLALDCNLIDLQPARAAKCSHNVNSFVKYWLYLVATFPWLKGIIRCKFNSWSNSPWNCVRLPLERSS